MGIWSYSASLVSNILAHKLPLLLYLVALEGEVEFETLVYLLCSAAELPYS